MEKNYLNRVVWIVLFVVFALLGLYWLPDVQVGEWSMRKIDLLADLRNDSTNSSLNNSTGEDVPGKDKKSLANIPMLEGSYLTHDKDGNVITVEDSIINSVAERGPKSDSVTSIVDMSGGEAWGMDGFYDALSHSSSRPVRIAVLGDSYIEGDIMTAMLRELLQQRFGGSGCGYLPITAITAKNRLTVRQTFDGWTQHKAVDHQGYEDAYNNITGNYFICSRNAWVNMVGVDRYYSRSGSCTSSSLYYMGETGEGVVSAYVNGEFKGQYSLDDYASVAKVTVAGDINTVKWVVDDGSGLVFLGASMDSETGVIVDNLGMRSSRGTHLSRINDRILAGFNELRPYDLVIIMYGLNVAAEKVKDLTNYCDQMTQAIEKIKRCMPSTSVLLVSCSDRESRGRDGFHTMKGVLGLIQAQKRVAINSRLPFWNLYDAMGGEGSIVNMVNKGEAARDYTHLTGRGGDRIARLLYDALMLGYEHR